MIGIVLFVVGLLWKPSNPIIAGSKPVSVQIISEEGKTSGIIDALPAGVQGLIVDYMTTDLPVDGYRYYHWNANCRDIVGLAVTEPKGISPQVTIYYKDKCK